MKPASGMRRAAQKGTLVLVATMLALTAAEGLARLRPEILGPLHSRGPGLRRELTPDPTVIRGVRGPSVYSTNLHGERGGERIGAGDERILCLGGSTTECLYLDDARTWPALLERLHPFGTRWVGNLGISGYAAPEHLDFLRRAPASAIPSTIIVMVGANDFLKSLNASLRPWPEPWWSRLELVQIAHSTNRRIKARRYIELTEDISGHSLLSRRGNRRRQLERGLELPPLASALHDYRARIRAMAQVASERGATIVFATQPVLWAEEMTPADRDTLWLGWNERVEYFPPGELRRGIDRFNAALLEVCQEESLDCIDLGPLSGRSELFYDDCHFTEAGARVVATTIAHHLAARTDQGP